MIRNDRFSSHNDFKECVWVEVPLLSWFDHGETVEMTLQYGKAAEMEKRDLWPGLIRRWQGARYVHGNVIAPNLKTHSSSSKPIWQQRQRPSTVLSQQ